MGDDLGFLPLKAVALALLTGTDADVTIGFHRAAPLHFL
jgi:hypothetical protein